MSLIFNYLNSNVNFCKLFKINSDVCGEFSLVPTKKAIELVPKIQHEDPTMLFDHGSRCHIHKLPQITII